MIIRDLILSDDLNARVTFDDRWLVGSKGMFVVYQHKHRAKRSIVLYAGDDEERAVATLLGGHND